MDSKRLRNTLTKQQVIDIFCQKPDIRLRPKQADTCAIAKQYGVTAKAIRDIWIGRTWYRETFHLDPFRMDANKRLAIRIGRPKGAKDVRPRMKRSDIPDQDADIAEAKKSAGMDIFGVKTQSSDEEAQQSPIYHEGKQLKQNFQVLRSNPESQLNRLISNVDYSKIIFPDLKSTIFQDQIYEQFNDPFHDDWPYWHNSDQANSTKRKISGLFPESPANRPSEQ